MGQARLYERYLRLRESVGWDGADQARMSQVEPLVRPALPLLIEEFHEEIQRYPEVRAVITGGPGQIDRLKHSLMCWLGDLLGGSYDEACVARRWSVGRRHVEIGLDPLYVGAALSRLRTGMLRALGDAWPSERPGLTDAMLTLSKIVDLDKSLIDDAYQAEAFAQLQRAERLATLGQIAGGIAHELRNPLNVIKTSAYYLENAPELSLEKRLEQLRRIERHVDVANGVITTLTNLARLPVPVIEPVAVDDCLREALELDSPGPAIQVEIRCPPALPLVLADMEQLRIVFGNLIRNARDAMAARGGWLTIEASEVSSQPSAEVAIAFQDTGSGITADVLARIGEPLFSTKQRGLGLGLAIVRNILERAGGRLEVTSEPGRGSLFRVVLRASSNTERPLTTA